MSRASWRSIVPVAVVAALAIGAFVVLESRQGDPEEQVGPNTEQVSTEGDNTFSSELPGVEYEFAPPSDFQDASEKKEEKPVKKPLPAPPDLSRPISPGVSSSTKAEMRKVITALQKDPSSAKLWLELGLYRKESGDYEGARQAWEFAWKLEPTDTVSADNLGVLYGYYLKNGLKSEEFFSAAIALEPQNIHLRLRLFELYRDVFQDKAKARAAIEAALKDNPGDEQLEALLKEL